MRRNSKTPSPKLSTGNPRQIRFHKDDEAEADALAKKNRFSFCDVARIAIHIGLKEIREGRANFLE